MVSAAVAIAATRPNLSDGARGVDEDDLFGAGLGCPTVTGVDETLGVEPDAGVGGACGKGVRLHVKGSEPATSWQFEGCYPGRNVDGS